MHLRLAIVCAAASLLSAKAAADPMVQVPGGVADESQQLAYLQNAHGGLDAVELATGRVRWSDARPQRPLAGASGRLLVERVDIGGVSLCVRATRERSGGCAATARLPLPQWAGGPSRGRSFDATVEWSGRDTLRYRWLAAKHWSQGMHPPRGRQADEGDPESQTASGVMQVDLKSGKISPAGAEPRPVASMAYETARGMQRTAWRVDGVWCVLATETIGGVSTWIVRRTGEDGRTLPPLKGGRAGTLIPRISLDGRLLVMPTTSSGPAPSLELPSGQAGPVLGVGTLSREFALAGSLLLEGVAVKSAATDPPSREVRATGLDDRLLKWTRPLYLPSAQPPPQ